MDALRQLVENFVLIQEGNFTILNHDHIIALIVHHAVSASQRIDIMAMLLRPVERDFILNAVTVGIAVAEGDHHFFQLVNRRRHFQPQLIQPFLIDVEGGAAVRHVGGDQRQRINSIAKGAGNASLRTFFIHFLNVRRILLNQIGHFNKQILVGHHVAGIQRADKDIRQIVAGKRDRLFLIPSRTDFYPF